MDEEKEIELEIELLEEIKRLTERCGDANAVREILNSLYKRGLIVFRSRVELSFCSWPILTKDGEKLLKIKGDVMTKE